MPISKENKARYPENWWQISQGIKRRAGWRCECTGQCGSPKHLDYVTSGLDLDGGRCPARHSEKSPLTGAKVVLTTAHLDHTPENCRDDNLLAMCQLCHLNYDKRQHAETRAARR